MLQVTPWQRSGVDTQCQLELQTSPAGQDCGVHLHKPSDTSQTSPWWSQTTPWQGSFTQRLLELQTELPGQEPAEHWHPAAGLQVSPVLQTTFWHLSAAHTPLTQIRPARHEISVHWQDTSPLAATHTHTGVSPLQFLVSQGLVSTTQTLDLSSQVSLTGQELAVHWHTATPLTIAQVGRVGSVHGLGAQGSLTVAASGPATGWPSELGEKQPRQTSAAQQAGTPRSICRPSQFRPPIRIPPCAFWCCTLPAPTVGATNVAAQARGPHLGRGARENPA
jgi:hypothetical protein